MEARPVIDPDSVEPPPSRNASSIAMRSLNGFSSADSGYCSLPPSGPDDGLPKVSASSGSSNFFNARPRPIEGTELFCFKRLPNLEQKTHYESIRPIIEARLQAQAAEREADHHYSLSLHAKVIGQDERRAVVHLVVLCAAHLKDSFAEMFTTNPIKDLLLVPGTFTKLGYLVIADPPASTNAMLDLDVCCQTHYVPSYRTFCGAPLIFRQRKRHGSRTNMLQGTFGGIVKVVYGNGDTLYYGMTAGHVISALNRQHEGPQTDFAEDAHMCSISGWISDDNILGRPLDLDRLPGVSANRAEVAYDWGLFEVSGPQPNEAIHPTFGEESVHEGTSGSHPIIIAQKPHTRDGICDPVLLQGSVGGPRRGELSPVSARIWLAYSKTFVDAYVLETEDSDVQKGDSGAWVVHATASELYGHAVATNSFGETYIMPALDSLENIRQCLGAVSVSLPNVPDLSYEVSARSTNKSGPSKNHLVPKKQIKQLKIHTPGNKFILERGRKAISKIRRWPSYLTRNFSNEPNRLWYDASEAFGSSSSLLDTFFAGFESSIPSWELYVARKFSEHSKHTQPESEAQVFSEDELITSQNKMIVATTPLELQALVSPKNADSSNHTRRSGRRVIQVVNLTPSFILAILPGVFQHEKVAVGEAICRYITSESSLRVSLTSDVFKTFRLEFHLPYFRLAESDDCNDTHQKIVPSSLILSSTRNAYEAQASLVIVGTNHSNWTAYSFLKNAKVIDNDVGPLLARSVSAEVVIDPRTCFVENVQHHLQHVVHEYMQLTRVMEAECSTLENLASDHLDNTEYLGTALDSAFQACKALRKLNRVLRNILKTWSRFVRHDSFYFSDLQDPHFLECYHQIKEQYGGLRKIADLLGHLEHSTEEAHRLLTLQVESNPHKKLHVQLLSNAVSSEMAKLNRKSTEAAVESSRLTRINVQMFLIITPFVLALQYFGDEKHIISFDRNPRTFSYCICVLFCILPLLTYLLEVVNEKWDQFTKFLLGHRSKEYDENSSLSAAVV